MTPTQPSASVLLFGVGSIGAVYLYQLQQAGCHVTAVCRSNHATVKSSGFRLNSHRYGNVTYKADKVVQEVSEVASQHFDYVLVCAKSVNGSQPSLPDILRPAVEGKPETAIVLAQNGIGIEDEVFREFPENPLISGVVYCPAVQTDPGVIEYQEMLNLIELDTYPATAPAAHKAVTERFAQLMIKGGGGAKVFEDIQIPRWSKLLMNAAWNPICALTLLTDGDFLRSSEFFAKDMVWSIMMEIVQLAKAMGVQEVDEKAAEEKFAIGQRRAETGTGRPMSMLQDVQRGRDIEVEAIVGNAVRMARAKGLTLVRLETIYALLKGRAEALIQQRSCRCNSQLI